VEGEGRTPQKRKNPKARPQSLDEALDYAKDMPGYKPEVVRHWYSHRDSQSWVKGNNHSVTNWRSDLDAWVLGNAAHANGKHPHKGSAQKPESERDYSW
jgi:hypothetical protein